MFYSCLKESLMNFLLSFQPNSVAIRRISRVAVFSSETAERVEPAQKIKVLTDEPVNRILECAVSGNADAIVTGDKGLLRLRGYERIKIISLKEYLGEQ